MSYNRLKQIRELLDTNNYDAIIIPKWDEFRSEFVNPVDDYLKWSTNFTGSYGLAYVGKEEAILFVDGRYTIQAKKETKGFQIFDIRQLSSWFKAHLVGKVLFDPWLFSENEIKSYSNDSVDFIPAPNFLDQIWVQRKKLQNKKQQIVTYTLAGETSLEKRDRVKKELGSCDYLLITDPENISWLLNIRNIEGDFVPSVSSYAILDRDGKVELFVDEAEAEALEEVFVFPKNNIVDRIRDLENSKFLVSKNAPIILTEKIPNKSVNTDPITLMKACKNEVEIESMQLIHRRDSAAVTEFLYWLLHTEEEVTELSAADALLDFRRYQRNFLNLSFPTISAAKEHSAIIHYQPQKSTNYTLEEGDVYLVDSGGQYWGGTTDVTRTVCLGAVEPKVKEIYTLVLKGHIALSSAIFPAGTTGGQLDVLARQFLWQKNLDYPHSTGHGVGTYLNVHEGPQSIGARLNQVPLKPGMVVSIEPGCYLEGTFGVRLENLVYVQDLNNGFYKFEPLTLVPFSPELIDSDSLTKQEKDWLYHYHNDLILQTIYSLISDDCFDWIMDITDHFS